MNLSRTKLSSFIGALIYVVAASAAADPASTASGLHSKPLFLGNTVPPNLIFDIDDSGSMDLEMAFDGLRDGLMRWDTTGQGFTNDEGEFYDNGARYAYLFPNGVGYPYDGRRTLSDNNTLYALPPVKAYAFARSSDYNLAYYNPNDTYTPWPSYGGYTFSNSDPAAARFEPVTTFTQGGTLNLLSNFSSDEAGKTFRTYEGMACNDLGTEGSGVDCAEDAEISYYPATYYKKITSSSSTFSLKKRDNTAFSTGSCDAPVASNYTQFIKYPAGLVSTSVDAIAHDGSCLEEVKIESSNNSYSYINEATGLAATRTFAEESVNFANWFTYYRRRHHAMRGSLAASLEGVNGIRTGMVWFNQLADVTMGAFDSSSNSTFVNNFMQAHYTTVNRGGTPTRASLDYVGKQYMRTGTNAPITSSCQRNFTLIFTDGYASDVGYDTDINNADSGLGEPYQDDHSDTLADIAMHYYKTNLRGTLDEGNSPIAGGCDAVTPDPQLDCNPDLHMNTYAVTLNASGNIFGKTIGANSYDAVEDAYTSSPTWVNPETAGGSVQADDLYHATINGRGQIYNADSPDQLKRDLQRVIDDILSDAATGSASSVAFNTSALKNNSLVMTASFNSSKWSGELEAFNLDDSDGDIQGSVWKASVQLDAMDADDRYIVTYNPNALTVPPALVPDKSVLFEWTNLSLTQQADLRMGPSGTETVAEGLERLNYLRGNRTLEGQPYRVRGSALGDIIHSSPVFVGEPELNYPDEAPFGVDGDYYSSFKIANEDRAPIVYVGANDGMLHGFYTEDVVINGVAKPAGSEAIAYIPNLLYSNGSNEGLHYLTDPSYTHKNYVDGTPTVADVYINNDWETVLVGSLRGGAKGVYALNVTDPEEFTDAKASERVMWEYTHADMGYMTGQPVIALMNNGKWAAVFGNGYGSSTLASKLFIIYIDGSTPTILDTGATTGGLSAPALADMDGDGKVDRVYSGDVAGNMWAFDVSASNGNWGVAYSSGNGNNAVDVPLFTAVNDDGEVQPITSSPVLALNPNVQTVTGNSGNEPNVLVLFGTGQYLVSSDPSNVDEQSFYAVWDNGTDSLTRSSLDSVTLTNVTGGFRTTTDPDTDDANKDGVNWSTQYGWYIDFDTDEGERIVLAPNVRSDIVFFNTLIPSSDDCAAGGSGYLMSVQLKNGSTPENAIFDNGNNGLDDSDTPYSGQFIGNIPMDSGFLGDRQYTPTNVGTVETREIDLDNDTREGRLSWLEFFMD
jgi:type IV pilus assembly protein PilY1